MDRLSTILQLTCYNKHLFFYWAGWMTPNQDKRRGAYVSQACFHFE